MKLYVDFELSSISLMNSEPAKTRQQTFERLFVRNILPSIMPLSMQLYNIFSLDLLQA